MRKLTSHLLVRPYTYNTKINMLIIYITLITGAVYTLTACSFVGSDPATKGKPLAFDTILQSDSEGMSHVFESKEQVPVVLTNKEEEDEFVSVHEPRKSFPQVDYSEHAVIGILAGKRPNNSYSITIDSVFTTVQHATVHVTEIGSAEGGRIVTYPQHFVVVDREELKERDVEFDIERECIEGPCAWNLQ